MPPAVPRPPQGTSPRRGRLVQQRRPPAPPPPRVQSDYRQLHDGGARCHALAPAPPRNPAGCLPYDVAPAHLAELLANPEVGAVTAAGSPSLPALAPSRTHAGSDISPSPQPAAADMCRSTPARQDEQVRARFDATYAISLPNLRSLSDPGGGGHDGLALASAPPDYCARGPVRGPPRSRRPPGGGALVRAAPRAVPESSAAPSHMWPMKY